MEGLEIQVQAHLANTKAFIEYTKAFIEKMNDKYEG